MTGTAGQNTGTRTARDGVGPAERRQLRRSKIFTPVILTDGPDSMRAHLLDIGTGGALCFTETTLRCGAIVDIAWQDTQWAAEIIWIRNRRFGLRFLSPLAPAIIDSVIATPAA